MTKKEILNALTALNRELSELDIKGELCLYGGCVMCLAFDARSATKDVDAVFKPSFEIRNAAKKVAKQLGLPSDWLNDAVKRFLEPHEQELMLELGALNVYIPSAEYLLAMKALASRLDSMDKPDILFLINKLKLNSPKSVLDVIEKYYPRNRIKPATQFFIEEIFDEYNQGN